MAGASSVGAQRCDLRPTFAVGPAAFTTKADVFALNDQLANDGLPAVPHSVTAVGLDATATDRIVSADLGLDAFLSSTQRSPGSTISTGGANASITFGARVWCRGPWFVEPVVGVGVTRLDLAVSRGATSATVDSVFLGRTGGGLLSNRSAYDDFGLRISRAGPRFGGALRLGYVERFSSRPRWTLSGESISGQPKYGLSGVYARLSLMVAL